VLLGQGGYGEVRKCVSRSDKVVRAVKIIKKESITSEEH
jgi:serine/threonine protein kinase